MTDQTFPKKLRLVCSADFQRVFARRVSVSDEMASIYGCENGLDYTRIGLSVSRKVGKAVVRNRWKRLFREAFRTTRSDWPPGLDFVLIPRRGVEPDFHALQRLLPKSAQRVARRLQKKSLPPSETEAANPSVR